MKLTKKGFTLVEMLIVIVIIGILAAAIFPKLTGIQAKARDTARKADLNTLSTALAEYQLDNNTYVDGTTTFVKADTMMETLTTNGYLKDSLKDPQGQPYAYATNTAKTIFALAALSEGAKKGANWGADELSTQTVTIDAILEDNKTVGELNKKLCKAVTKGTSKSLTAQADNCTAVIPLQVVIN